MNGPFKIAHKLTVTAVPKEFDFLLPPPLLLPGERLEQYQALRQAIFADIEPRSSIEWLLAIDVAELSWEIRRYHLLRHKLLEAYRQQAIEAILRRVDVIGIAPEFEDKAEYYTVQNALSWRFDPTATTEIEARLTAYGFDQHSIIMEVYLPARELFLQFEGLLIAAQNRRLFLLREINSQRQGRGLSKKRESSSPA